MLLVYYLYLLGAIVVVGMVGEQKDTPLVGKVFICLLSWLFVAYFVGVMISAKLDSINASSNTENKQTPPGESTAKTDDSTP